MQVISFINMKGGVAKTTLCINVGHCLASQHNKRVLIIDIDPQFNATQCLIAPEAYEKQLQAGQHSIVSVFDTTPRVAVGAVSGAKTVPPPKLEEIKPVNVLKNMDLLPGNLDLYKIEMASGKGKEHRLQKFLDLASTKAAYDFVLIDTPPTPSVWMSASLLASKHYLIPVKPDPISFTGIDLLRRVIDELGENYGVTPACIGVVLTMAEPNTIVYQNCKAFLEKDERWKSYLYKHHLSKATAIAREQAKQHLILQLGDSGLKYSLTAICDELLQRLAPKPKATKK